jgi:hypothetical protein
MDLYEKDPAVTRALALALMRQARDYLAAIKEDEASSHLQLAVDTLLKPKAKASA